MSYAAPAERPSRPLPAPMSRSSAMDESRAGSVVPFPAPRQTGSTPDAAPGTTSLSLSADDVLMSLSTSVRMAPHIHTRTSGSKANLARHLARVWLGKVAEVGFARILETNGIDVETYTGGEMFKVYAGASNVDGTDFTLRAALGNVALDVKGLYEPNHLRLVCPAEQFEGRSSKDYYVASKVVFPTLAKQTGNEQTRGAWVGAAVERLISEADPVRLARLDALIAEFRAAERRLATAAADERPTAERRRESLAADIESTATVLAHAIFQSAGALLSDCTVHYLGVAAWRDLAKGGPGWEKSEKGEKPWSMECAAVSIPVSIPPHARATRPDQRPWPFDDTLGHFFADDLRPQPGRRKPPVASAQPAPAAPAAPSGVLGTIDPKGFLDALAASGKAFLLSSSTAADGSAALLVTSVAVDDDGNITVA